MTKANENGRSMVEMLGVLAIIGVLSAGGLAGYSKAMYKYRVNETMNQLTMIVSNIRTLFGSQNTYEGLNVGNSLTYGIITPDMAATKDNNGNVTKIQNPFKGDVIISAVGGRKSTDNEAFVIEYKNLPAEACVTIVTSDWGSAAGSGLVAIAALGGKTTAVLNTSSGALPTGTGNTVDAPTDTFGLAGEMAAKVAITAANPAPFTIQNAVAACVPDSGDTSGNASIALKYY